MNNFSNIPQLEKLLSTTALVELSAKIGRRNVLVEADAYLQTLRQNIKNHKNITVPTLEECAKQIEKNCRTILRSMITPVVNATGVVLHTNLGRSPLPSGVWAEAEEIASEYSSVELDLTDGKRGKRFSFLTESLSLLTGSEAALVVNNNASAVFLLLKALADGKEVIVSRGQQVQIGGGFRIPEILKLAGCNLVEVGTTNVTTLQDITQAITENTAMVLAVHSSNYKIRGFTDFPTYAQIKQALPKDVIFAVDQGSGNIASNIADEVSVREILKAGADLVCFSGDKIFGGPQAGCIVGKKALVEAISKHQLMRTYRVGRAVAALMQACLVRFLNGQASAASTSLEISAQVILERCENIFASLNQAIKEKASVVKAFFSLGGGSTPDVTFETYAIKLNVRSAEGVKKNLRNLARPIIAVVEDGAVMLYLVTVLEKYDGYLVEALNSLQEPLI